MAQFRDGSRSDLSRVETLKHEELIEEIEYLTTENRELHAKVKDVCAVNAELKLNLTSMRTRQ